MAPQGFENGTPTPGWFDLINNGSAPGPDRHILEVSSPSGKVLTAIVTSEVFSTGPTLCDVAADGVYTEP